MDKGNEQIKIYIIVKDPDAVEVEYYAHTFGIGDRWTDNRAEATQWGTMDRVLPVFAKVQQRWGRAQVRVVNCREVGIAATGK